MVGLLSPSHFCSSSPTSVGVSFATYPPYPSASFNAVYRSHSANPTREDMDVVARSLQVFQRLKGMCVCVCVCSHVTLLFLSSSLFAFCFVLLFFIVVVVLLTQV